MARTIDLAADMMRRLTLVVVMAGTAFGAAPQPRSVADWLARYATGHFDAVMQEVAADGNYDRLLDGLKSDTGAWVAAVAPVNRTKSELAAATLALEAARLDAWNEWKWKLPVPPPLVGEILYWKAPPLLIEWGCQLLTHSSVDRAVERWWQLAALSVAERGEDEEFLLGPIVLAPVNLSDEIAHLDHVRKRFPNEPRFALGVAVALEWSDVRQARTALDALKNDPDVGAEATLRLGHLRMTARDEGGAIDLFDKAAARTRDPWLVYLAHYFKGQVLDRQKHVDDAVREYRKALAAVPAAESASVALSALLFQREEREAAAAMGSRMLTTRPRPDDPARQYSDGDDRLWPQLIGRLRAEILR